jgi:hypothetical protein
MSVKGEFSRLIERLCKGFAKAWASLTKGIRKACLFLYKPFGNFINTHKNKKRSQKHKKSQLKTHQKRTAPFTGVPLEIL